MGEADKTVGAESLTVAPTQKHSKVISGYWTHNDILHWRYTTRILIPREEAGIEVRFPVLIKDTPTPQKSDALKTLLSNMAKTAVPWVVPGRRDWAFNLAVMTTVFPDLREFPWAKGRVFVEPDFEVVKERTALGSSKYFETSVVFYISPEVLDMHPLHGAPPVEIQNSLKHFRLDHPDPSKVAFVMMRFGKTIAHDGIVAGINAALTPHGINSVRADDKEYHTELYYNILTYLYGCGFGIAVFERIETENFNPNISLEVGYFLALKKEVCLLKDKTLTTLHADLIGKLYRTFDPLDPVTSIPPTLSNWIRDKGII